MSNVDKNLILKLSRLVRLNLTKKEIDILSLDLNDILSSFTKLNSITNKDYDEFDDSLKENNQTRKDISSKSWDKKVLLDSAPNHDGDELSIEQVLGEE